MASKKKNVKIHFRRRSLERVGMIVDEIELIKKIQKQELEFVYSQSNRRKVYRTEILGQVFRVIYDKERKQLITIYPENVADNQSKAAKRVLNEFDLIMIERCKQLPKIETFEDCLQFYKKFFELSLFDFDYNNPEHNSYMNKPIEELTRDEVLTSFTVIQREEYWEGGYGYIFNGRIEDKTFEKLYNRLQELIKEVEDENR